jgi:hypothetical protein
MVLIFAVSASQALIFYSTGDAAYNTNAPAGTLQDSGWQWQGEWSGNQSYWEYLGTPIAAHYFITAKHTGGDTNWVFRYQGATYKPLQQYEDASSDFEIWRVDKPFLSYAPLYIDSNESGRGCVIFGRGKTRGAVVVSTRTNGWLWGALDNKMRWGTNQVVGTSSGYLISEFDGAGDNECATADKDSGGAVFIKDAAGVWRLAGINYSIAPAQFSTSSDGSSPFYASCFDYRGLYYYNGSWVYASNPIKKQQIYATQISARYSWITNMIGNELDQDVDFMPDWWEAQYTNSVTAMTPDEDSDGDGFSNVQEYLADTNPTNAASFFENTGTLALDSQTFYFNGSTGRQYQVFYTTNNLATTDLSWIEANTNKVWGTGTNSSITVTNTGDTVFYRLWVTLP